MSKPRTLCLDYTDIFTEPRFELEAIVSHDGSSYHPSENPEQESHRMIQAALAHATRTPFLEPYPNKNIQRIWKHLHKQSWRDGSLLQAHLVTHPTQADHLIFVIGKSKDVFHRTSMPHQKKLDVERATSHVMRSGFHVSSIAYKKTYAGKISKDDTHELEFLAHIIMRPVIRKNISAMHRDLEKNNIRLRILSHDSLDTCKAILKHAGRFYSHESCETGERIQSMHDAELASILSNTFLFADLTELDKQRIIRLLEQQGEEVLTTYGNHPR